MRPTPPTVEAASLDEAEPGQRLVLSDVAREFGVSVRDLAVVARMPVHQMWLLISTGHWPPRRDPQPTPTDHGAAKLTTAHRLEAARPQAAHAAALPKRHQTHVAPRWRARSHGVGLGVLPDFGLTNFPSSSTLWALWATPR